MTTFIKNILFSFIIFIIIFLAVLYTIKEYKKETSGYTYVIKSYKNTVALYKNNELIKIYDSIVLNTLSPKDIKSFNDGIAVSTLIQAEEVLEDYDG